MKPELTLIAGVEIAHGRIGGLVPGAAPIDDRITDPAVAARRWIDEGAMWIHLADLDAAAGVGSNADAMKAVARAAAGRAHLQVAGGIRDAASFNAAVALKPQRIVLDTAAVADLGFVADVMRDHADRVAIDLEVHRLDLYAPGTAVHGQPLTDVIVDLETAGCRSFMVTDVDAVGSRKGSKREALKVVCELERHHVIAGGGVAHLHDLQKLMELIPRGLQAVVLDHALYDGAFTYPEAVATIQPRYDLFVWGPPQP
jgi:phosphoribosylformimino-5-aminoimidazole carboxamide ribonucleotide (ProFAR) isomerase